MKDKKLLIVYILLGLLIAISTGDPKLLAEALKNLSMLLGNMEVLKDFLTTLT